MSDFLGRFLRIYEPPASWAPGQDRAWYAKAIYPGSDTPLVIVGVLAVMIVVGTYYMLIDALQGPSYLSLAVWVLFGVPLAGRYALAFTALLRKRP